MTSVSGQQFRLTQPPSKVIHLRNLPWECTAEELIEFGTPFGKVINTKCNVGTNKNQAFIEFVSTLYLYLFLYYHFPNWFIKHQISLLSFKLSLKSQVSCLTYPSLVQ
jgi:RNA recognition motif. (a.k.a. RRM, RBD, or RNP domain)